MKLLLMVLAMGLVALQSVTATFIDPDQVVLRTGDTLPLTRALFMSDVEASEGNKREAAERFWTEKAMPMYEKGDTVRGSHWNDFYRDHLASKRQIKPWGLFNWLKRMLKDLFERVRHH